MFIIFIYNDYIYSSIQRLTPTQLKQIAHVLQQRSQEAATSNERVVYRLVYRLIYLLLFIIRHNKILYLYELNVCLELYFLKNWICKLGIQEIY